MLNKKFASIRATANVKTEKRSSVASSNNNMMMNQRLSQSQSMEMYGINFQQTNKQQSNNEQFLMNMTKDSLRSTTPSSAQYDPQQQQQRPSIVNSSPSTPVRNPMMMKSSQHPHVNLMHQQYHSGSNNVSPHQHLQYQNHSNNTSAMSFGSPIMIDNQSWNSLNPNQTSPLVTHYTAAQIYMSPKNYMHRQPQQNIPQHSPQLIPTQPQQQVSSSPKVVHKKIPPEVPKRMPSTVSTTSIKKQNGLSRSGIIIEIFKIDRIS